MSEDSVKKHVEIEAPSPEQIRAAKQMRRQMDLPSLQPATASQKKSRRYVVEGVVLLFIAGALAFFLHPLGEMNMIIGLIPAIAGIGLLVKGSMESK